MNNPSSFVASKELQINPAKKSFAKFILVLGLFLSLTVNYAWAQEELDVSGDWPCAQTLDDTGCGPWIGQSIYFGMAMPDCVIMLDFKFRICNGVYQFAYENLTYSGNCEGMAEFSIYHYNINSILEMLDIAMVEYVHTGMPTIPGCGDPNGPLKKMKIYSAGCGVWVKCSYEINPNATIKKDRGYEGNCPTSYMNDGKPYVDVWKWQSCGTVCCKREYEVCKEWDITHSFNNIKVTRLPAVPLGPCTLQNTFGPWENSSANYQCQQACDN